LRRALLPVTLAVEKLAQNRLVKALSTIPDNTALAPAPRAQKWTRLRVHLRVFAIAILFGLGAYAVIQVLIAITRHLGWLDWLHA
jgi:hypothetical protein